MLDSNDFEQLLKNAAQEIIDSTEIEIECPTCNKNILISTGANQCKYCKQEIDFNAQL